MCGGIYERLDECGDGCDGRVDEDGVSGGTNDNKISSRFMLRCFCVTLAGDGLGGFWMYESWGKARRRADTGDGDAF